VLDAEGFDTSSVLGAVDASPEVARARRGQFPGVVEGAGGCRRFQPCALRMFVDLFKFPALT